MKRATAPTSKLGIPIPNPVASAMISDLLSPSSSCSASDAPCVDVAVELAEVSAGNEFTLLADVAVPVPVPFESSSVVVVLGALILTSTFAV